MRVDGGADGAGDGQRRGGEPEFVHAVGGAVGGERVEVPHLADEQADVRDGDLVQRLEGVVELVGPHLEAPGVGGDRGDLGAVQPAGGGERQPGRRRRRRTRPSPPGGPGSAARCGRARCRRGRRARSWPCAAIVGSRCSAVMANPSGSSPSAADDPADVEQHAAPGDDGATVSMPVTRSPSLVTTSPAAPPVPRLAVVEDVPEAVPLGGALQRHERPRRRRRRCRAGSPGCPRSASMPGVEHGVHRVGPAPPALLRPVHVEALRQREARRPGAPARRPRRRLASSRKFSVPSTSSAPQRPQLEYSLGGLGDRALGVGAVQAVIDLSVRPRRSGCAATPSPVMEPSMTSPSRSSRPQWMPLPAGLPVSTRSPGSSRAVCEAARDQPARRRRSCPWWTRPAWSRR